VVMAGVGVAVVTGTSVGDSSASSQPVMRMANDRMSSGIIMISSLFMSASSPYFNSNWLQM
jgi:hypothetical protein